MNYYLVSLKRLKFETILRIHIRAPSHLDALRHVRNQMIVKNDWVTDGYHVCECPEDIPIAVYYGVILWREVNEIGNVVFHAMFPGTYESILLDTDATNLSDVKVFLSGILTHTY